MINNRGLAKKWTGMMMPEHIHQLKEWESTLSNQYPKEKTDWELEDMQRTILSAYHKKHFIILKLWRGKWSNESGFITALNNNQGELLLDTEISIKRIKFTEIDAIQVVDE